MKLARQLPGTWSNHTALPTEAPKQLSGPKQTSESLRLFQKAPSKSKKQKTARTVNVPWNKAFEFGLSQEGLGCLISALGVGVNSGSGVCDRIRVFWIGCRPVSWDFFTQPGPSPGKSRQLFGPSHAAWGFCTPRLLVKTLFSGAQR